MDRCAAAKAECNIYQVAINARLPSLIPPFIRIALDSRRDRRSSFVPIDRRPTPPRSHCSNASFHAFEGNQRRLTGARNLSLAGCRAYLNQL